MPAPARRWPPSAAARLAGEGSTACCSPGLDRHALQRMGKRAAAQADEAAPAATASASGREQRRTGRRRRPRRASRGERIRCERSARRACATPPRRRCRQYAADAAPTSARSVVDDDGGDRQAPSVDRESAAKLRCRRGRRAATGSRRRMGDLHEGRAKARLGKQRCRSAAADEAGAGRRRRRPLGRRSVGTALRHARCRAGRTGAHGALTSRSMPCRHCSCFLTLSKALSTGLRGPRRTSRAPRRPTSRAGTAIEHPGRLEAARRQRRPEHHRHAGRRPGPTQTRHSGRCVQPGAQPRSCPSS